MTFARKPLATTASLVMIATIAVGGPARAAKPCLTREEAQGMTMFVLPQAIEALGAKCGPVLPADALLAARSGAFAARYRTDAASAWPTARSAFAKLSSPTVLSLIGDDAARRMIAGTVGAGITDEIKPTDCAMIDRIATAVEPLPSNNMAMLLGALIELGATRSKGNDVPFTLCQVPTPLPAPVTGTRR